ncbi:riboflavin kinase-like [Tubulanus polymorphus]|uniref:riboflavin kinase-like n=1 Tax=Tubulanus polymorphus TaxID=672921 RepID=UPI003DA5ECDF
MSPTSSRQQSLPHFAQGRVVKGFGRGSKELGIPTANFPEDVVDNLPDDIESGIYHGWATVDDGPIYKMVMSIGWNPFYKNEKRSMETHIINKFDGDFYGCTLKIVMLGYIRPEKSFDSLGSLISEIHNDISEAERQLDLPHNQVYKEDAFFDVQGRR